MGFKLVHTMSFDENLEWVGAHSHTHTFVIIMIPSVNRKGPKKQSFQDKASKWATDRDVMKTTVTPVYNQAVLGPIRKLCEEFELLIECLRLGLSVRSGELSWVGHEIVRLLERSGINEKDPQVTHFWETGRKAIRDGLIRNMVGL